MFQPSGDGKYWKISFQEGVDVIEDIFKGSYYVNTPEEYLEYAARYDLTFLTPCNREIRCKVRVKGTITQGFPGWPTYPAWLGELTGEMTFPGIACPDCQYPASTNKQNNKNISFHFFFSLF